MIMKKDGLVVRSRAVREMGQGITWDDIRDLTSEPHDPTGTMKAVESIPRAQVEPADKEDVEDFRGAPRRTRRRQS